MESGSLQLFATRRVTAVIIRLTAFLLQCVQPVFALEIYFRLLAVHSILIQNALGQVLVLRVTYPGRVELFIHETLSIFDQEGTLTLRFQSLTSFDLLYYDTMIVGYTISLRTNIALLISRVSKSALDELKRKFSLQDLDVFFQDLEGHVFTGSVAGIQFIFYLDYFIRFLDEFIDIVELFFRFYLNDNGAEE